MKVFTTAHLLDQVSNLLNEYFVTSSIDCPGSSFLLLSLVWTSLSLVALNFPFVQMDQIENSFQGQCQNWIRVITHFLVEDPITFILNIFGLLLILIDLIYNHCDNWKINFSAKSTSVYVSVKILLDEKVNFG